MVCAPVRSIIPSLKLGDYLSVQAHKTCSISHLGFLNVPSVFNLVKLKIKAICFKKISYSPVVIC